MERARAMVKVSAMSMRTRTITHRRIDLERTSPSPHVMHDARSERGEDEISHLRHTARFERLLPTVGVRCSCGFVWFG